jgi:non-ribosomal peptide synthetase component F
MSAMVSPASAPDHSSTDRYAGLRYAGLIDRFAAQVLRRPEAVAVSRGEARVSYGQRDEPANRVAARLAAMDEAGAVVALGMPRSLELIVGMLGVAKAGATYLPIGTWRGRACAMMPAANFVPLMPEGR